MVPPFSSAYMVYYFLTFLNNFFPHLEKMKSIIFLEFIEIVQKVDDNTFIILRRNGGIFKSKLA